MEISVFIDAHAHLYPNHDPARWLESFVENVHALGPHLDMAVAFITESDNEGAWQRLVESPEHGWGVTHRNDASVWLENPFEDQPIKYVLLVRGRQLVTQERLEVLAVMGDLARIEASDPASLSLEQLVDCVDANGGLAIIPWGFGKWTGKRGRVLRAWLETRTKTRGKGWLADSGGRPSWLDSSLVSRWHNDEFIDIAGSDPLRLKGHEAYIGRCGIEVRMDHDLLASATPAFDLIEYIVKLSNRSVNYRFLARRPNVFQFIRDQVALRLK